MQITYIGHSGFLIEWGKCYWLFDYFNGTIPDLDATKKLFVFASHKHADHFNPAILELTKKYLSVEYVLSSDIKLKKEHELYLHKVVSVKPSQEVELEDGKGSKIILKTLKSTDCGVAFLLQYQGKTIYHAGDLNLWVFKEESKQYNNNMTSLFNKIIEALKDIPIDIAFAPLDPRQEEWYSLGLNKLLDTANVKYVFPMHFWDKPEIIKQYKRERSQQLNHAMVMDIVQAGQMWNLDV